jgi:plasmid stability protein
MKNITVSLDDETYRKARVRAAELDTSVSAVVRKFLTEFAEKESRFERLQKQEEAVRARIEKFSAEDRLPRDQLYDRKL